MPRDYIMIPLSHSHNMYKEIRKNVGLPIIWGDDLSEYRNIYDPVKEHMEHIMWQVYRMDMMCFYKTEYGSVMNGKIIRPKDYV